MDYVSLLFAFAFVFLFIILVYILKQYVKDWGLQPTLRFILLSPGLLD